MAATDTVARREIADLKEHIAKLQDDMHARFDGIDGQLAIILKSIETVNRLIDLNDQRLENHHGMLTTIVEYVTQDESDE